jgi:hypothetical protein
MEERAMAKRMRRTRKNGSEERRSTTEALAAQARDVSVSAVKVATETARAALEGMQEVGRVMADMAAPAARRAVKTASEVTQATVAEGTRASRSTTRAAVGTRPTGSPGARPGTRATRSSVGLRPSDSTRGPRASGGKRKGKRRAA